MVDRPLWPAHGRWYAHLASDRSYEELHGFARELGLDGRLFHADHYDIPADRVADAVAMGAEQVDPRVLAARLRASGLRRRRSAGSGTA